MLTQNTVCCAEKQQTWQISNPQQYSWWKTIQNRSSLCILSVVSSSKMSWLSLGCRQGWKQENDSNITYYSSITNPSCRPNRTSIWTLLHQCKVNNRTGDLLIELAELGWAPIFLSDEKVVVLSLSNFISEDSLLPDLFRVWFAFSVEAVLHVQAAYGWTQTE